MEYVNEQNSVNFDKVDNLKLFDSSEENFQVEMNVSKPLNKLETK